MSEVVTFIPDAGGSIVINGKCFFIKISLISGISDTKIGLKSGNLFTDVLQIMVESHTVSAFLLMENYSCSTELMFL